MAKKEEQKNGESIQNRKNQDGQLEIKIAELRKANEETIRLKNVEKFAATERMVRAIAHEIRNPLTNIGLALEQLTSELPDNEDTNLLVSMISRNAGRIDQLITDLLKSTKFALLSFSSESINAILDEIIEELSHFVRHKNVLIKKEFAEHLPLLMVDNEKIKTAFENLVTYVIESVLPNEGKILITTENKNNKCVITIISNGAAIGKDKIEQLFEPHFTGKSGSGLALTLSQNIILNHGGSLYVESEMGKGVTFTVILDFA